MKSRYFHICLPIPRENACFVIIRKTQKHQKYIRSQAGWARPIIPATHEGEAGVFIYFYLFIFLLFICAFKAWVISPPCPNPLPYHPLHPLPLPPPSIPSRNYFALFSNFVEERV
jgi:hypothetical protein